MRIIIKGGVWKNTEDEILKVKLWTTMKILSLFSQPEKKQPTDQGRCWFSLGEQLIRPLSASMERTSGRVFHPCWSARQQVSAKRDGWNGWIPAFAR